MDAKSFVEELTTYNDRITAVRVGNWVLYRDLQTGESHWHWSPLRWGKSASQISTELREA